MKRVVVIVAAGLMLASCANRAEIVANRADVDDRKTVETNEAGEEIICRKDKQTGSRIRVTKVCGTQAEWDKIDEENDKHMKDMNKSWTNRQ